MVTTRGGWNTCTQNVLREISIIVVGSQYDKKAPFGLLAQCLRGINRVSWILHRV